VLEQVCTAPMLRKSEKILSLMSLNSKKKPHCPLATAELFPNKTGVAIGNPERHVRKASHRGSKQQ